MENENTARTYSEVVGSMLRQERQDQGWMNSESLLEQLKRQLEGGITVEALELELSGLVSCPECRPGEPCATCAQDSAEIDRELRDHLRRLQSSGTDLVAYLGEANSFHAMWQERFEHLHLAAMGGEFAC